jgi:hypothetical protein
LTVHIGLLVRMEIHAAARHAHRIPPQRPWTTAKRPSHRGGMKRVNHDFWKKESKIFSATGLGETI